MVGTRALGLVCSDPQRGALGLHELAELAALPSDTEGVGVAAIVDGAALLSRQPSLAPGATLADAVGAVKGRCTLVQVRVRSELRPNGPDGHANSGPFRARSYAAAVVGGPQQPDEAQASREALVAGLPDFFRRFLHGQSEAEAFFIAVLARLHQRGALDTPHNNGLLMAEATRELMERHAGGARHVVVTNGVEAVHVAVGMPSAVVTLQGLTEETANRIDPTLCDSSMGRERLRRFRGVFALGALSTPLKASTPVPPGATLQVLPDSAAVLLQRELTVRLL